MDDQVSRVMVEVEGHINPTTFRLVEKNKDKFLDDPMIIQLLASAVYEGKSFGYHVSAGAEEYTSAGSWQRAEEKLEYMKKSIIKMHAFVMENYKF